MKHEFSIHIRGTIEDIIENETEPLTEEEMEITIQEVIGSLPEKGLSDSGVKVTYVHFHIGT